MATVILDEPALIDNFAELLERLGNVPLHRIRLRSLGNATEADVVAARIAVNKRLCELIDGVLVEKAMGTREALLAGLILYALWDHVKKHNLGIVLGADGMLRLSPGRVRIPDACFISWDRLPAGRLPDDPVASVVPDLAVEVLSEGNTDAEIRLKLDDYFRAKVRLVWIIDPGTQTADVYRSLTDRSKIERHQNLDGGDVLPGFMLALEDLFAGAEKPK